MRCKCRKRKAVKQREILCNTILDSLTIDPKRFNLRSPVIYKNYLVINKQYNGKLSDTLYQDTVQSLKEIKKLFMGVDIANVLLDSTSIKLLSFIRFKRLRLRNISVSESDLDSILDVKGLRGVEIGKIHSDTGWRAIRNFLLTEVPVVFTNIINIRTIKPSDTFLLSRFVLSDLDSEQDFVSTTSIAKLLKGLSTVDSMEVFEYNSNFPIGTTLKYLMSQESSKSKRKMWFVPSYSFQISSENNQRTIFPFSSQIRFRIVVNTQALQNSIHSLVSYTTSMELTLDVSYSFRYANSDAFEYLKKYELV